MEATQCVVLGESCAFGSTGNEKLWIPSKLREIRLDQGKPPGILATDLMEKAKEDYRTGV